MPDLIVSLGLTVPTAALVSGGVAWLIEKRKYNQDFWKKCIEKRLSAYERIDELLPYFQSVHFVEGKPCHLAFMSHDSIDALQNTLSQLSWCRQWIAQPTYNVLIEMNRLAYMYNAEGLSAEQFGVKYYEQFRKLRDMLLFLLPKDYDKMADVPRFLKQKSK